MDAVKSSEPLIRVGSALEIVLRPIGYVRTEFSDEEVKRSLSGVEAEIEVLEEFEEGLEGIEEFSHIIVLFYMHKAAGVEAPLKQRPRKLLRYGLTLEELPLVGVFCLDSPHRPNPIGLTVVELLERRGRRLRVRGLDAFDGTPVLDIKPYTPSRLVRDFRLPGWYEELLERVRELGLSDL